MKESVCNNCKYYKEIRSSFGKCIKKNVWKDKHSFCKKYFEVKDR